MKQRGKKYNEWIKDRAKLIKDAVISGRITINEAGNIYGRCEDCKEWKALSPDHKKKRSQGGGNEAGNIDWVCFKCHNLRDNYGDPMKKKESKSKKPDWQKEHRCVNCKVLTRQYLCHSCGKASIK